jgi:septum formation protein
LGEEEGRKKIILASSSPRRRRILELIKLDFDIIEPEDYLERNLSNPYRTVVLNSSSKARNVYDRITTGKDGKGLEKGYKNEFLVTGFDTIVYLKNKYFGKPSSKKQAEEYLKFFSGKTHLVISGVCILNSLTGKYLYDTETTRVKFRKLSSVEIKEYVEKENIFDKAGAYNIYGLGSTLVERIDGCFYNVVGLPIFKFVNLLKKFNYKILG